MKIGETSGEEEEEWTGLIGVDSTVNKQDGGDCGKMRIVKGNYSNGGVYGDWIGGGVERGWNSWKESLQLPSDTIHQLYNGSVNKS